jgi:Uma2 family endonuclease
MAVALKAEPRQKRRLYTADDLLKLPEGERYELIRGELIPMSPPPGGEHGNTIERIGARASTFVFDHELGECFAAETGFKIQENPDTVKGPDWAFIRKDRIKGPMVKTHVPIIPDIVLEVRSPSDTLREFAERAAMWIAAGVTLVWALDPATKTLDVHREHEVHHLGRDDTLSGDEILPGFELPLWKVFGKPNK